MDCSTALCFTLIKALQKLDLPTFIFSDQVCKNSDFFSSDNGRPILTENIDFV